MIGACPAGKRAGHRGQLTRDPSGQIWKNLSIRINHENNKRPRWAPPVIGQHHIMCHLTGCNGKTQHHFSGSPAKGASPEPSYEEVSDKIKLRDILQNDWPVVFRNAKVMKTKERLSNCSILKKTKETWQLMATHDFQQDLCAIKTILGTTWTGAED